MNCNFAIADVEQLCKRQKHSPYRGQRSLVRCMSGSSPGAGASQPRVTRDRFQGQYQVKWKGLY